MDKERPKRKQKTYHVKKFYPNQRVAVISNNTITLFFVKKYNLPINNLHFPFLKQSLDDFPKYPNDFYKSSDSFLFELYWFVTCNSFGNPC